MTGHSSPIASQQCNWWAVHEWVQPLLDAAGDYPAAGTPAWEALPDDDRRKWAACLDAAQHHALRIEIAQAAMTQASHAISSAVDWKAAAVEMSGRAAFYAERPYLARVAS
jgi:hypothetical protein